MPSATISKPWEDGSEAATGTAEVVFPCGMLREIAPVCGDVQTSAATWLPRQIRSIAPVSVEKNDAIEGDN